MIGSQAKAKPSALGTMVQASTYGATIPTIYGTTQSALLAIWAGWLRKGDSNKKDKKKGMTTYVENIDFLVGSNPITGILQVWNNQTPCLLNFVKYTATASSTSPITIPDAGFYALIAVTAEIANAGTFNDYGSSVYGAGVIGASAVQAGGSGYAVNDTFSIGGPGSGAFGHVTAVSGGAVTAYVIDNLGGGYTVAVHTTTATSGIGTGFTINVTSLGEAYNSTTEYPLYNIWQHGPGLNDPNYTRRFPFIFKWAPSDGATVSFPSLDGYYSASNYGIPGWNKVLHFYYAQVDFFGIPLAKNRMFFEPTLGSGTEYLIGLQQIKYPEYAGVASSDLDLGAGPAIPDIRVEVSGSYSRYAPRGDADFADMIEDTIKSGVLQVGSQLGLIQRGVNLGELPGAVDKMQYSTTINNGESEPYWAGFQQPIKAGQILFAMAKWTTALAGAPPTISDNAGNTWIPIFTATNWGFWYAIASAHYAAGDNIRIHLNDAPSASDWYRAHAWVMDPDSNEINNTSVASGTVGASLAFISCSIVVTKAPAYLVAGVVSDEGWAFGGLTSKDPPPLPPHWNNLFPQAIPSVQNNSSCVAYRIVTVPGTYEFTIKANDTSHWAIGMVAITQSQPGQIPKTLGDILDKTSLDVLRAQCQAAGLWGSVNMNAQQAASDWIKQFAQCANASPVWSAFVLKFIARSEVSAVGNGVVFTAPTASGPVATLTESDLIGDLSGPLITVERKAQVDANNILQIQYFDRNSQYNQSSASEPMSGAIALFGPRKDSPMVLPMVQDPLVARMILGIEVRRFTLLRNVYSFKMKAKWAALEATDLIQVNDSKMGITNLPVRLTKIVENDKFELNCEAEPFVYGCNSPNPALAVTAAAPYDPGVGADPGSVNTPIIFEPPPRLLAQQNQAQIWCVVSGAATAYGGCIVEISTDGGVSYNPVGAIRGNAPTGYTVGDWPIANDPDTTNDLSVDLTESLGTLNPIAAVDEDNFVYPCIVLPGLTCIPYELMTYAVATLTAANKYTLKATGGGTNHLRRAVFSCPQPTAGVDHPNNSRFAFLSPAGTGIFKLNMDPLWIGKTLYFKFLAFNAFNLNQQDPSAATAYSYTPTGCPSAAQNPNANNYSLTGGALTNPTSTTIDMARATATFPSNTAVYNARVFTIPAPSVPTTYYVTIADPSQLGDEGTGTTLTATCQTSNALVGVPGNIYIGSIVALPAGGGTVTGSGGASPGGANGDEILVNGT